MFVFQALFPTSQDSVNQMKTELHDLSLQSIEQEKVRCGGTMFLDVISFLHQK